MALGAHHDDIELRAGGTLAKYAQEGAEVIYVIVTNTPHYFLRREEIEAGHYLSNNEVVSLRKQESKQGADIIGVSQVCFLDYKSLYWYKPGTVDRIYPDGIRCKSSDLAYLEDEVRGKEFIVTAHRIKRVVRDLADFIADHNVDIVLTHSADDRHWEHYLTSNFVLEAVRRLIGRGEHISFYGWEYGGMGTLNRSFAPTHFEDISDTIDIKCEALRVFKSQFPDHNPEEFALRARARAAAYGELCGMEYAEPFVDFNITGDDAGMEVTLPPTYTPPKNIVGLE